MRRCLLVVTLFCSIYDLDKCSHSGWASLLRKLLFLLNFTQSSIAIHLQDMCSVTNTSSCTVFPHNVCLFTVHSAVHLSLSFPSTWLFHLTTEKPGVVYALALPSSKQSFSTFLMLWSFNTIPHNVMTPDYKNCFYCYLLIVILLLLWNIM